MDPVTLIVAALTVGASAGVTDTVSQGIKDAYAGLKALVLRRVKDTPAGEVAVVEHEKDPEVWSAPLAQKLADAGADHDQQLIDAAQRLLQLADPAGANAGRYTVNIKATGDRSIAAHTIHGGAHTGDATGTGQG
jgi:lipoprotein-anchoring transpeptidase ErfK/SrfK